MALVRSFVGYYPPARFDDVPFTGMNLQESESASGPWTTIETFTLDPVDADAAEPQSRSFTTPNATLTSAWYRTVWTAGSDTFAGQPVFYDDSPTTIASVADVLRVMRIDNVSAEDQNRILEAIRVVEVWVRRYLRWASLGTDGPITDTYYGQTDVPVAGAVSAVSMVRYPGGDSQPVDPDSYVIDGNRLRLIIDPLAVWPGLPDDELHLPDNFSLTVTTDPEGIDPLIRDGVALAAGSLWYRSPRSSKGITGENIGDYGYTVAQLRSGDPFFEEAKSLLRPFRRIRQLVP